MQQLSFKIEDFEGPLDLLLTLIAKHKMSILDIEIIVIINQYLNVINNAKTQDLDIASEFIDMAARLIYLKSVYLLPKDEEGEKLKAELQGQLIEYSQAKIAATHLKTVFIGDTIFTRQQVTINEDLTYDIIHNSDVLVKAYSMLSDKNLRRTAPTTGKFEPVLSAPVVSVKAKIYTLLKYLMKNNFTSVKAAFSNISTRSEGVATFLALLELIRGQRLKVDDQGQISLHHRIRSEK